MYDQNEIKLLHEAFFAIAESYTSMVYVDVADKRTYPIRLDDFAKRYEDVLEKNPKIEDALAQYVSDAVFEEDAKEVMSYADCANVRKMLEEKNALLHIYRVIHNDRIVYYRMKIVPIEGGAKLVYGFENIDSQYRKQMEINSERERQMKVLDGLSREFTSVWYLDGKSRKVKLVRNNGRPGENEGPVEIGQSIVDYHFSMQKYFASFVESGDFERLMHETSYEELVKNSGDDNLYCVDYMRFNPDKTSSRFQLCYAKTTDADGIANFVMGFRKLDRKQ